MTVTEMRRASRAQGRALLRLLEKLYTGRGLETVAPKDRVEDVMKEGDEVEGKVLEGGRDGKIRLSRRALLPLPEGPAIARNSPSSTSSEMPRRAGTMIFPTSGGMRSCPHVASISRTIHSPASLAGPGSSSRT